MNRGTVWTLTLVLLSSACAGGQPPPAPVASASVEAEPKMAKTTLAQTCPLIEATLPSSMITTDKDWKTYAEELKVLRDAGDVESQNAIDILLPPVETLAADPPDTSAILDARSNLRAALDTLAGRCRAVGSSALQ